MSVAVDQTRAHGQQPAGWHSGGVSDPHEHRVQSSDLVFAGRVISVRKDIVTMPGDTTSQRDVVVHPGAVGVVALDDRGQVLLVNQYRHPVRRRLDELPAGLDRKSVV